MKYIDINKNSIIEEIKFKEEEESNSNPPMKISSELAQTLGFSSSHDFIESLTTKQSTSVAEPAKSI